MRLKNKILFFAVALCGIAACNPATKFSVVEARMPTLHGLTALHGEATVGNASARDLMIENATFVVSYRGRELGSARLLLPVAIPAGRTTSVRYDLALEGVSLSSLQTLQSRIATNPGAFTVDVDGWVRWGAMRRKIEMKDVEATRLIGIIATLQ
jgi:hypothetical protein